MSVIAWKSSSVSGDWGVASNWAGGKVPLATDTVSLFATTATITIGSGDNETVAAITTGNGSNGTIVLSGGTLSITGDAAVGEKFTITSGRLNLGDTTTLSGPVDAALTNAGTITKATGSGTATITPLITNTGTISVTSGALNLSNYIDNYGVISVSGATLTLGTLAGSGRVIASSGATLNLNHGGTLSNRISVDATSTVSLGGPATFDIEGSTLDLSFRVLLDSGWLYIPGKVLTLHNVGLLGAISLSGTLVTTGLVPESGFNVLGGKWQIDGAATQSGSDLQLGVTNSFVVIDASGSLTFADDTGIEDNGVPTYKFVANAGTLAKTGGTGTSDVAVEVQNTGTISVQSGTLAIDGDVVNSGAISIAAGAALQLNGGGTLGGTLANAGTGRLRLGAGRFTLAQSLAWNGVDIAGILAFSAGQSFTLGGADGLSGEVTGAGTLTLSGTATLGDGATIDDGAALVINGTASLASGSLWLDAASGDAAAGTAAATGSLTIAKGATLSLAGGTVAIGSHAISGKLQVAGTLAVGAGTNFTLAADTDNTGTVALNSATATFTHSFTNEGTLALTASNLAFNTAFTNQGTITLAGSNITFNASLTQSGTLQIGDQSSVTLTQDGVLAPVFTTSGSGVLRLAAGTRYTLGTASTTITGNIDDHAALTVASGQTLTLAGNDTLSGEIDGPGTVTLSGQAVGNALTLTAGVTFNVTGGLTLTSGSLTDEATLAIAAGGSLALTGGAAVVSNTAAGAVQNAGTITTGADGSTITLNAPITNSGAITANGGKLVLTGATSNTGTITAKGGTITLNAISGHGQVVANGTSHIVIAGGAYFDPTYTIASGATLEFDNTITLAAAATSFATAVTLHGMVQFASGQALTLSGTDTLYAGGITGAGQLITTGTDAEAGFVVKNGATWEIAGTVSQAKSGLTGANGTLQIDAGGTFALTDSTGISLTGTGSRIIVAGTLSKTGGANITTITGPITASGTISVATGVLGLAGTLDGTGSLSIAGGAGVTFNGAANFGGTISNAGTISCVAKSASSFSGAIANTGTIDVGTSSLKLSGALTGTGTLKIEAGGTLELAAMPPASQAIVFDGNGQVPAGGTGAHLILDTFGAAGISGIADGDSIDFAGVAIQSAVIDGTTLTVTATDGRTAVFNSAISFGNLTPAIASDGNGGSTVTFNADHTPVPELAKTSYSFNVTPAFPASFHLYLTNGALFRNGDTLSATVLSTTGPVVATGSVTGLVPGASDGSDLSITVDPITPGAYTATVTLGFTSPTDPTVTLPNQTVTITGTVTADAVPQWSAPAGYTITGDAKTGYVLDLGRKLSGYAAFTLPIEVINAAIGNSVNLTGNFSVSGSLLSAGTSLAASGNVAADMAFTVNSLAPGLETGTITFSPLEYADGFSASLPNITLTVKLQVDDTVVYTLDAAGGTLVANPAYNAIFQITAPALNKSATAPSGGWSLTGSPGSGGFPASNELDLIGPGTFNLNKLAAVNGVDTIIAREGQRAYGTIAATRQGVILRDGATEKLYCYSEPATPGNPLQIGMDIVAGTGTYTIVLGSRHDHVQLGSGTATITLDSVGNSVSGGNGTGVIIASRARASALIQGNGVGSITMDVSNAGVVTLNPGDRNLTVGLKGGSTLNMGAGSGIVADGRGGNNVINLQATAQTAIGGNNCVLNGAAAGGDTFQFYKFCGINTVNGFIASGTNHDMVAIATKAFADFAHLLGATTQVGSDLLITIDAADQITLKNVALASFTSADVRFF